MDSFSKIDKIKDLGLLFITVSNSKILVPAIDMIVYTTGSWISLKGIFKILKHELNLKSL